MTIRGTTGILGIFGDPVAHSLSPAMQNAALRQCGIDAVYVPFHVRPQRLEGAVAAVRSLDIRGVNVTVPHKEEICRYLDAIDAEARLIGAVNTIVNRQGTLTGYNTDGLGLLRSLEEDFGFRPEGRRILLLGAGGACRAALVALARAGAAWIGVANRTRSRADALVREFEKKLVGTSFASFASLNLQAEALAAVLPDADLVVNTSSVGLKGEAFAALPLDALNPRASVYDMVYLPGGTPLLRTARERGHRAADGSGMLAAQGEEAFRLWTGVSPPAGQMRAAVLRELSSRECS